MAINYNDTMTSSDFTWANDKVSCWRNMYFAHVAFCYVVLLTGLGCMLTRLWPGPARWQLHRWFGFGYIVSMLWTMGTSLVIHNEGLPPAVLVSFVWVLGGLTIGWAVIRLHDSKMNAAAFEMAKDDIMSGASKSLTLDEVLAQHKRAVASKKSFAQSFFSYRMVHASFMFTSWLNIAGRIFASNQSGDFTCYTVPAFKPISTPHGDFTGSEQLQALPAYDPNFSTLPWAKTGLLGWGALLSVVPVLLAAGIYASCLACAQRNRARPVAIKAKSDMRERAESSDADKSEVTIGSSAA
jgi:hypothetical protein